MEHLHISADSRSFSRKADILFAPFFPRKTEPNSPELTEGHQWMEHLHVSADSRSFSRKANILFAP